jgi:gamma-glutamyltranspeptidase/glutathione hydrolase
MNHNATCAMIYHRTTDMRGKAHHRLTAGLTLALAAVSCLAQSVQPELPSAISAKKGVAAQTYAIATANPLASQAGLEMLQAGGSAVDAAIAAQMVLALVEPQSSGLGGGAFLLHFDGKKTQAFDGRETAPAGVTPSLFLQSDGKAMPFQQAVVGGRSVGTPGVLRMLSMAHAQHGKLPWARLFAPAIALASNGFAVSPRMAGLLQAETALKSDRFAASYFYDTHGQAWPAGHRLRNPELAAVLQAIATQGSDAVMTGAVAQAMVQAVHKHPTNPGTLTLQDLANYTPVLREPLCMRYRVDKSSQVAAKNYRICGMPPPSSGMVAIGQILGILQQTQAHVHPFDPDTPRSDWLHLYAESAKLAFADRAQFIADPAFVAAPGSGWNSLLAPAYLAQRAQSIQAQGPAMKNVQPGNPGFVKVSYAPMPHQTEYGTSHLSIVDRFGNAVAMTTTIEDAWGARVMVNRGVGLEGGFLLNNQLTDFSFTPASANGLPIANRVEPGKRPRSSMSPTLVFDDDSGQLLMSLGSPGGALIIHFTAKTLLGLLNGGLNAQSAIDVANFGTLGGPLFLEQNRFPNASIENLKALGHEVIQVPMPSGLQAIVRTPQGWLGGADPRREGVVLGD